jgi:hypothetical protein
MASYSTGNVIRLSVAFTVNGAAADPSTVSVAIVQPNGATATVTYPTGIVKDSVGAYHYDFTPTVQGPHNYRWTGTGTAAAAGASSFIVTG